MRLIRLGCRLAVPTKPGAFRLWLAMLVFVHHFSSLALGSGAVDVFFVLSGVWIERMWQERYRHTRSPYVTYLVSRIWRLAPAMLLASAITLPMLPMLGTAWSRIAPAPLHLVVSSVLLLGYGWLAYLPVFPAWSLDVEMQFYLVAPMLALLAHRTHPMVLVGLGVLISLLGWRLGGPATLLPYCMFFAIGMAAARGRWRPTPRLAVASAAAVVACVAIIWLSPLRPVLIGGAHPLAPFRYNPAFNAALALLAVPFALSTADRPGDADDRMMADLSYLVYLLHWVGAQWFYTVHGSLRDRLAVAMTCFAVVPIVAWLVWRFYDRPINHARARWVARRMVVAHEPTPSGAAPGATDTPAA